VAVRSAKTRTCECEAKPIHPHGLASGVFFCHVMCSGRMLLATPDQVGGGRGGGEHAASIGPRSHGPSKHVHSGWTFPDRAYREWNSYANPGACCLLISLRHGRSSEGPGAVILILVRQRATTGYGLPFIPKQPRSKGPRASDPSSLQGLGGCLVRVWWLRGVRPHARPCTAIHG